MNWISEALLAVGIVFCLGMVTASFAFDEPQPGQQVAQETQVEVDGKTITMRYWLFLPKNYDGQQKLPLMVFLHGAGERGDELEKVKAWGPPKRVANDADFPFILVSPQCPADQWWNVDAVAHLTDFIAGEYQVDKQRMYLTGLSMGGYGTWGLLAKHPNLFAAAIPICGGGDPAAVAAFKHVPIWAFHGDADEVVPPEQSRRMVEALKELDAPVKYTEYEGVGHNSWSQAYATKEIYPWLLSHQRKPAGK